MAVKNFNFPKNLKSGKLFADDTSLFSTQCALPESTNLLNDDLKKNTGMGFRMEKDI